MWKKLVGKKLSKDTEKALLEQLILNILSSREYILYTQYRESLSQVADASERDACRTVQSWNLWCMLLLSSSSNIKCNTEICCTMDLHMLCYQVYSWRGLFTQMEYVLRITYDIDTYSWTCQRMLKRTGVGWNLSVPPPIHKNIGLTPALKITQAEILQLYLNLINQRIWAKSL